MTLGKLQCWYSIAMLLFHYKRYRLLKILIVHHSSHIEYSYKAEKVKNKKSKITGNKHMYSVLTTA